MNVLVVGSGGREHALASKLASCRDAGTVYVAPGNGGTKNNVSIEATDVMALADYAQDKGCFTVVGPEAALSAGLVDELRLRGLGAFGPTKAAAQIESSKAWAKDFMARHGIPTAKYGTFSDPDEAERFAESLGNEAVIKADGLAAGKGVIVCQGRGEARRAISSIMRERSFGDAGARAVVEERLHGQEASYIAMCDSKDAVPLASSQDHKRAGDGDTGPNTGGMGAYSPAPIVTGQLAAEIDSKVIGPAVSGMASEGAPFTGFLYAGIMVTDGGPKVLEFNARMGDPECQPIVERMDFDLLEYMHACASGRLAELPLPEWKPQSAACVVLASRGYPGACPTGQEITGLDGAGSAASVFHAGTASKNGRTVTAGGRVLGVTCLGDTLEEAVSSAYSACSMISWPAKYCRTDIGARAGQGS